MLLEKDFDKIPSKYLGGWFIDSHYFQGENDQDYNTKILASIGSILYSLDKFTTIVTVEPNQDIIKLCNDILRHYPQDVTFYSSLSELQKNIPNDVDNAVIYLKNCDEIAEFNLGPSSNILYIVDNITNDVVPNGFVKTVIYNKLFIERNLTV